MDGSLDKILLLVLIHDIGMVVLSFVNHVRSMIR